MVVKKIYDVTYTMNLFYHKRKKKGKYHSHLFKFRACFIEERHSSFTSNSLSFDTYSSSKIKAIDRERDSTTWLGIKCRRKTFNFSIIRCRSRIWYKKHITNEQNILPWPAMFSQSQVLQLVEFPTNQYTPQNKIMDRHTSKAISCRW